MLRYRLIVLLASDDVPAADMNIINGVFRKGVTLYHSHDTIGTY